MPAEQPPAQLAHMVACDLPSQLGRIQDGKDLATAREGGRQVAELRACQWMEVSAVELAG